MNIQQLLTQADWRLRAYFGAPSTDVRLVGWRRDACGCPVREWLFFEEMLHSDLFDEVVSVDAEWIVLQKAIIATPPVLSHFIDQIDRREPAIFCGESTRVDRAEAEATLLQAEHQAAQRLLPAYVASIDRCDYRDDRGSCRQRAVSPLLYGFLDMNPHPHSKPQQASCRLFVGRLCEEHAQALVVPPDSWWPQESSAELVEAIA